MLLPRYPPDLGRPDHVFYRRLPMGDTTIMIWLDQDQPDDIRLAFYQIHMPDYLTKYHSLIEGTTVNGRHAIWFEGGHLLQLVDGRSSKPLFVAGNVLLWADGEVTYRLESPLPLAEVLAIAETLAPAAGDRLDHNQISDAETQRSRGKISVSLLLRVKINADGAN